MDLDTSPAAAPAADDVGPWYTSLNRYHWFVLTVAALGWMFDCMDQRIFMVSAQDALRDLLGSGVSEDTVKWYRGLATSIFMIGWATGGLFFGIMGDRWGRARTMMLTILVYSLFTGLTALSVFWWDYTIYRFLTGMGVGGEFAAGASLLAEAMPARARAYALGMLQALSAVGNIAGSLLSWAFSWRELFLLGIAPALLVGLVMRRLKEPATWEKAKRLEEAPAAPGRPEREMGSLSEMLHDRRWRYHTIVGVLLALAGVIGLWGVGFWTFELVVGVLRAQGYTDKEDIDRVRAIGTALQDVGAAFGIYTFSLIAARVGRRAAFAYGFAAALAATVFVFGTMRTEADVYWMLPLLGFCNLGIFGGYAIYFPELYPTRLRSTGTGFCYNVARYLAAVGPFTLGALVGWYRSLLGLEASDLTPFRYATLTVASIYILGLVVLPFAPETRGKPLPE
jgi:MFS family permease